MRGSNSFATDGTPVELSPLDCDTLWKATISVNNSRARNFLRNQSRENFAFLAVAPMYLHDVGFNLAAGEIYSKSFSNLRQPVVLPHS